MQSILPPPRSEHRPMGGHYVTGISRNPKLDSAPTLALKTARRRRNSSRSSRSRRRARSLSISDTGSAYDSSDDGGIHAPASPPPIIEHLSHYVKHAKTQRKPYLRDGPSTLERRYTASQLCPTQSMALADSQKVC